MKEDKELILQVLKEILEIEKENLFKIEYDSSSSFGKFLIKLDMLAASKNIKISFERDININSMKIITELNNTKNVMSFEIKSLNEMFIHTYSIDDTANLVFSHLEKQFKNV